MNYDNRNELRKYAIDLIHENLHNVTMKNLSKIQDNERFSNWYHGYTRIQLPIKPINAIMENFGEYIYSVETTALSGNISSQYFGEYFDAEKVVAGITFMVHVYPPAHNDERCFFIKMNMIIDSDIDQLLYGSLNPANPNNYL